MPTFAKISTGIVIAALGVSALALVPPLTPAQADDERSTPQVCAAALAHINMSEVTLGLVAGTRTADEPVRRFAERMVRDHGALQLLLMDAAHRAQVTLPDQLDPKHQQLVTDLRAKSGAQFETAFVDAMIKGHETAVQKLEQAQATHPAGPIKDYAALALSVIKEHLQQARRLQQERRP